MNVLFVHQNFPGQYRHLAPALAARRGYRVVALGENPAEPLPRVEHLRYRKPAGPGERTHPYLKRTEAYLRRGQEVARACLALRERGFRPDLIAAHPGWGEALFLRDVFPQARLLLYCEYYYRAEGGDVGFDPINGPVDIDKAARTRVQNAVHLLQLEAADWGVAPTQWQWSRFPDWARARISVLHEGVDTRFASPEGPAEFALPDGRRLRRGDPVVTYVARQLEPYRGFHVFMRALPALQRRAPEAQVVIVGGDGVSYGGPPPGGGTWKEALLRELAGQIDLSRVHFVGRIPYGQLLALFRVSAAHLYLTYPFVLSWSVLEAMACGAAVLASATAPVEEVLREGENGLLVDFFDSEGIAERLAAMLADQEGLRPLREAARRSVVERYDLTAVCLPRQIALIEDVARTGRSLAGPAAQGV
ncbi:MAG: glycosyltransferase family 4 protein [Rhodovarius sp.]|nr:glycosyltransferase family 4 protein [Rhodovarius sp.]